MAGTDPHDEAYRLGMSGKQLPPRLLNQGDESILEAWREGKADRPDDQPDSQPQPEPTPAPRPSTKTSKSSSKTSTRTRSKTTSTGSSRSGARPRSSQGRRTSQPSLANPTGGRLPIGFDGEGLAGSFFGAVLYALIISVADYGSKGPLYWFKAKFMNQPAPAKGSSS